MLKGKKTYVVAAAMIFYAVVVLGLQGGDWGAVSKMVLEALAIVGLRIGVGAKS